ncbi:MAG TPA: hypothetical protein PJ986_15345 [Gammaproteobacteria bacterium]|nr:hypothetical protein [Gammaproteobacteria bacterium]
MSADILKRWLAGARPGALWVEYDDYAGRVFAGAPADWLSQAVRYANTLGQARKIVRTDVLTIDLTAPCLARAPAAGSPAERARAALEDAGARAFGTEVLDALAHKFAGDTDLALKIASPRDLLRRCGEQGEPSFDDLDELATALAGLLRALADKPVAALLVAREDAQAWTADEAEACEPLFSAAHHYGWATALGVGAALLEGGEEFSGVDLLLCAEAPAGRLAARERPRVGGGLPEAYWRGDAAPALPAGTLAYGVIPADAEPERIVARCAALG